MNNEVSKVSKVSIQYGRIFKWSDTKTHFNEKNLELLGLSKEEGLQILDLIDGKDTDQNKKAELNKVIMKLCAAIKEKVNVTDSLGQAQENLCKIFGGNLESASFLLGIILKTIEETKGKVNLFQFNKFDKEYIDNYIELMKLDILSDNEQEILAKKEPVKLIEKLSAEQIIELSNKAQKTLAENAPMELIKKLSAEQITELSNKVQIILAEKEPMELIKKLSAEQIIKLH